MKEMGKTTAGLTLLGTVCTVILAALLFPACGNTLSSLLAFYDEHASPASSGTPEPTPTQETSAEPTPTPTPDQVVSLLAIPGVTAPVAGENPVTSIDATQYSGTVSWNPQVVEFFTGNTVYTATIDLTPKSGWTLVGVAANAFTVEGATSASNSADSGVVLAAFPKTTLLCMITVPAGSFQRDPTVTNISVITVPYRMSQFEITRAQFLTVMGADPSQTAYSSGTGDPVQTVNWYHAIAFCNKLSLSEGLTTVYSVSGVEFSTLTYAAIPTTGNGTWSAASAQWSATGYRLPTEMEWMWAAMGAPADGQGGGTNTTGYLKAFAGSTGSNVIGDYAWYSDNSGSKTHPVGTKSANELGFYDMSGNVHERCWDWYGTYPTGTLTDYRGAASGEYRVYRGGSWYYEASHSTVVHRSAYYPYIQGDTIGFRVVRP